MPASNQQWGQHSPPAGRGREEEVEGAAPFPASARLGGCVSLGSSLLWLGKLG